MENEVDLDGELTGADDELITVINHRGIRHERLAKKNKAVIDRFMGKGKRAYEVAIAPRYYGELLAWALQRQIERDGWQVVRILGYAHPEPNYLDVNTDYEQRENLLMNGVQLVRRGDDRLIITVDISLRWRNSILVEGPEAKKALVKGFVEEVTALTKKENIYQGKKIEFSDGLRFLNVSERTWESITLNEETKREIRANSIGFLKKAQAWAGLGIPRKRGILLAGEPGTGKTAICKALMAEADGMTCIIANAYDLANEDYITELYDLAESLAPCLVFIEDVDFIAQGREEFGYRSGPAIPSLLAVLDGIEERKEIVTIATTNCPDMLDKALSERPSRFDRVIKLTRPNPCHRRALIDRVCERIVLEEWARDYIARRSEGCTPAQIQEIIFSLAIEQGEPPMPGKPFSVTPDTIDGVITRINGRKLELGFRMPRNGAGASAPFLSSAECQGQAG